MTTFTPRPIGKIPLVDIKRPFKITIDEIDRQAIQCDPWECVIANALNRMSGITNAQVGAQYVRFTKHGVPTRGELSTNARKMIRAYDADNQIMPAGIQIDVMVPRERLNQGRATSKKPKSQR